MGYLNSEKPPEKWSSSYFKMFVERVRLAVNYLDSNNFPNGLLEIQHTIFGLADVKTINSTTLVNIGGFIMWDNTAYGSDVKLYFEIVGGSPSTAATATFELHGISGKIAEVSSASGVITTLRSAGFSPPTVGQTLSVKAKTSSASYPSQVLSARLIIRI